MELHSFSKILSYFFKGNLKLFPYILIWQGLIQVFLHSFYCFHWIWYISDSKTELHSFSKILSYFLKGNLKLLCNERILSEITNNKIIIPKLRDFFYIFIVSDLFIFEIKTNTFIIEYKFFIEPLCVICWEFWFCIFFVPSTEIRKHYFHFTLDILFIFS